MASKRSKSNGEGTIYTTTKNGKKYYRGQISIGIDDEGKLIRKSFSSYTKSEVVKKMQEYQHKMNTGQISTDDKITLQEWFYTWLFEFRINDLKPSSFERYEGIYRNYIKDTTIGKMKLVDLRAANLQKYFNDLKDEVTLSTIHTIKKFLNTCLNEAERQNYITKNYCKSVKLPKYEEVSDDYDAFTLDEQKLFLETIKGHPYELPIVFNLGTGLRLGELLALRWTDIDFINNTVTIDTSIKRVTFIDKEGNRENKIIEQSPKTTSSKRTVTIPSNIMTMLKKHLKQQTAYKKDNELYNDNDFVFCEKTGEPYDPKKLPRNFKSVLKKAGIRDMKYHSIRHSYATRLFERDRKVKTVQELLGHKDITTTMNIYTHVMPEEKTDAAESIDDLFGVQ